MLRPLHAFNEFGNCSKAIAAGANREESITDHTDTAALTSAGRMAVPCVTANSGSRGPGGLSALHAILWLDFALPHTQCFSDNSLMVTKNTFCTYARINGAQQLQVQARGA
jgi:hypothetical protein